MSLTIGQRITIQGGVWVVVDKCQKRQTRAVQVYDDDSEEALQTWAREYNPEDMEAGYDTWWALVSRDPLEDRPGYTKPGFWQISKTRDFNKVMGWLCPISEVDQEDNEYGEVSP